MGRLNICSSLYGNNYCHDTRCIFCGVVLYSAFLSIALWAVLSFTVSCWVRHCVWNHVHYAYLIWGDMGIHLLLFLLMPPMLSFPESTVGNYDTNPQLLPLLLLLLPTTTTTTTTSITTTATTTSAATPNDATNVESQEWATSKPTPTSTTATTTTNYNYHLCYSYFFYHRHGYYYFYRHCYSYWCH